MKNKYTCKDCAFVVEIVAGEIPPLRCEGCGRDAFWLRVVSGDPVTKAQHYQSENGIEAIDALEAALGTEGCAIWCRGTAMKYLWRAGKKVNEIEDLQKAGYYIQKEIELRQKLVAKCATA